MTDLFTVLAGGLNVLNGVLTFLLKLNELRKKIKRCRSKNGKNKRSAKRTLRKNP